MISLQWYRYHDAMCELCSGSQRMISLQNFPHYSDVIMGAMVCQITGVSIVYSNVWSRIDQTKHQSSAWLAFVRGLHRWPVKSPHKGPVTRKMFPFHDVIMTPQFAIRMKWQLCCRGMYQIVFSRLIVYMFYLTYTSQLYLNLIKYPCIHFVHSHSLDSF